MPKLYDSCMDRLKTWRSVKAKQGKKPAFAVFKDKLLTSILEHLPTTKAEFEDVPGLGPGKYSRYGEDIVRFCIEFRKLGLQPTKVATPKPQAWKKKKEITGTPDPENREWIRKWRSRRAKDVGNPAYAVFSDKILDRIAIVLPTTEKEFEEIPGLSTGKWESFGKEITDLCIKLRKGVIQPLPRAPPLTTGKKRKHTTESTRKSTPGSTVSSVSYDAEDREKLREFRSKIAKDTYLPSYNVFSDKILDQLAHHLPRNEEEFCAIRGLGPGKWEKFGSEVVLLCLECRSNKIDRMHNPKPKKARTALTNHKSGTTASKTGAKSGRSSICSWLGW